MVVVALVVAVGSYLTWLAGRLDRLAMRVEAARASLDAQLVRRAAAAQALAARAQSPGRSSPLDDLAAAATAALEAAPERREAAESALTRAVRAVVGDPDVLDAAPVPSTTPSTTLSTTPSTAPTAGGSGALATVAADAPVDLPAQLVGDAVTAATRVQLARQFHNDAVHASLALRRRRLVRWLRLYGRARRPAYFEIDDALR